MILMVNVLFSILAGVVLNGRPADRSYPVNEFVGETMHYNMKYGIFTIGIASISCFEDQEGCGQIIRAEAQSTGLLKIFMDLDYRFECCMDPVTGLPNSAIMDLKDGNTVEYSSVIFDHHSRSDSTIIISQTTGLHIVPKNTHDLLTGYYQFRRDYLTKCTQDGQPVVIQTYLSDMLWDLKMTYAGGEVISTMFGEVPSYRFISSTMVGSFFRNDDDMTVWFTEEDIPVPVKIRLKLKIGSIKADLDSYQMPALGAR